MQLDLDHTNAVIVHPNEFGTVTVIRASGVYSLLETARKDVPAGVPFLLVPREQMPTDRIFRNAWQADFSTPTGYGVGHDAWFAEQVAKEAA